MEPVNAETDSALETAKDEKRRLENLGKEEEVEEEEDEDFDDEEDDDDDLDDDEDVDDDEDDDDEDDDVGTDENGNEILKMHAAPAEGPLAEQDAQSAPDVSSDRVPATDAEPEGSLDRVKSAALGIQEIENLEDDAKGG